MTAPISRREAIRQKIYACVEIVDTGYRDETGAASCCHLWTAGDSGTGRGGGYARMWLDGQMVAVHIVSWVNEHGFVPGKKQLDHLCHVRRCVNDQHLELVTHKQNQRRRDRHNGVKRRPKKRQPRQQPAEATLQ